jgi:alkylation response protein AidB-like acyl-CoA dehydrogenase
MLDLALAHARERSQFGQLIGTFQAVRHKLAEAHVAVAAAEAAALAAWESDDAWLAATVAKLVTSRSCATTVAHTQQVLAGIGFTAEHPFPRLMKRALVLDRILGTAVDLAPVVGRQLVLQGCAPRLVDL